MFIFEFFGVMTSCPAGCIILILLGYGIKKLVEAVKEQQAAYYYKNWTERQMDYNIRHYDEAVERVRQNQIRKMKQSGSPSKQDDNKGSDQNHDAASRGITV